MLTASMSFLSIFIFSFVIAIGAVVSPGPVSTTIVSQAPSRGWKVGPMIASGHAFLELLVVLLIAIGLGSILNKHAIQITISLLGGGLLAFMGIKMVSDVTRRKINLPDTLNPALISSTGQLVGLGMLATISNPFWYAWWVTVAASILTQGKGASVSAASAFYLGHITADFTWDTILSTLVGGSRRWMNNVTYRLIILVCGIFFIYLAMVFIGKGVNLLR